MTLKVTLHIAETNSTAYVLDYSPEYPYQQSKIYFIKTFDISMMAGIALLCYNETTRITDVLHPNNKARLSNFQSSLIQIPEVEEWHHFIKLHLHKDFTIYYCDGVN